MQYDFEKLIDILVVFVKRGQELTELRINKLLYFIDRFHLRKYGRFVLNDRYFRLPFGPIPSFTYNIISEFFRPDFPIPKKHRNIEKDYMKEYFEPAKNRQGHDRLKLKKEVNLGSLSDSEKETIDIVIQKYGKLTTSQLVNISHREKTCKETAAPNEIDYELFLEGLSEERKKIIKDMMEMDGENDIFTTELNK